MKGYLWLDPVTQNGGDIQYGVRIRRFFVVQVALCRSLLRYVGLRSDGPLSVCTDVIELCALASASTMVISKTSARVHLCRLPMHFALQF